MAPFACQIGNAEENT